ncbi:hypothetical protein EDC04DRAFT_2607560 [Pisolithus marmoratus]|nr:hypothetical protein EDC04DRAFT_2607560 [Pisolithus marmoratus]
MVQSGMKGQFGVGGRESRNVKDTCQRDTQRTSVESHTDSHISGSGYGLMQWMSSNHMSASMWVMNITSILACFCSTTGCLILQVKKLIWDHCQPHLVIQSHSNIHHPALWVKWKRVHGVIGPEMLGHGWLQLHHPVVINVNIWEYCIKTVMRANIQSIIQIMWSLVGVKYKVNIHLCMGIPSGKLTGYLSNIK